MTDHDTDPERTFAALPPAQGRGFAQTWWGHAWLKALEDTALDGQQVRTGRRLARSGAVGAVSVRPGRITAVVHDRDRTAHRADVLLERLSDAQWARFLDLAVERSGHLAALLDRDLPPHLVEDASAAGIELLPGIGDLEPRCDCEAWDHCGHTSALCHLVARLLDQDPFVLLLMRGCDERTLFGELRARDAARDEAPSAPEGVDAAAAYAPGRTLPALPPPPGPLAGPGLPPSLGTDAAPPPGVDPAALEFLAAHTAATAHRWLVGVREAAPPGYPADDGLTAAQDAVRLAAGRWEGIDGTGHPGGADDVLLDRLAKGSGRSRAQLARAVRAWLAGGAAGLSVLEEEWTPDGEAQARARAALTSAWEEDRPSLRATGNRWTVVGTAHQLRLGQDGRWWPFHKENGHWEPAGAAAQDPATALATAQGTPAGDTPPQDAAAQETTAPDPALEGP
ncbi:SWF or SNF family helicase [Streptomyces sp. NRRL S-340]|uniref:SWIM zinc finger family protein n=1 Tax=Streptomyces sp. NRRL S-340 TaxID=1463901 RepID=UPI00099C13FA|nr:SWF or SNF family helicase [Streptomyces sp. NRRL S-340]